MVYQAKEFATNRHNSIGQMYGNLPYTFHLEMVVTVAIKYIQLIPVADQDNVLAACWCHDLIEDTGTTKEQLAKQTNPRISEIVYNVSNEPAKTRREKVIKTLPKIMGDQYSIFVKLCDRIANTTNSKKEASDFFGKYKKEWPIFEYALRLNDHRFEEMWKELEGLYE